MRQLGKLVVIAVGFSNFGCGAVAQTMTGEQILEVCNRSGEDGVFAGYCPGFIVGTWEGMVLGSYIAGARSGEGPGSISDNNSRAFRTLKACPPADAENGQLVDAVLKFLGANPVIRQGSARILIHMAMADAFPCAD